MALIRHLGPNGDVGPCFERLFQWVIRVGVPSGRILTLSDDNPAMMAPALLRRSDGRPAMYGTLSQHADRHVTW